jgi:predicted metal-dependent phosphoesterase TrpH
VKVYPVDLQVHSTASDGTDAPSALIQLAADRGVRVLALTDHDSVLGVDEAIAVGGEIGVSIVPALEFSTMSERDRDLLDINILAYGIDHRHPDLRAMLDKIVQNRIEQKIRQVQRLQRYGVDVPVDEVLANAGGVPGRVHIANVALVRNPHLFTSINDVFCRYLAADAPNSTYVARAFSVTVEEAIELSHTAGGIAVLAHPGSYTRVRDIAGVVRRLADAGLDGLEICYTYAQNRGHRGASSKAVEAVIVGFDQLADECALLKTGGSDYHGATKPGIRVGQAGLTEEEWAQLSPHLALVYP